VRHFNWLAILSFKVVVMGALMVVATFCVAFSGDNNVKVLMVDTGKGSHFRVRVSFLLLLATRSFFCFILGSDA